jgi:anti-anti-sigma factor
MLDIVVEAVGDEVVLRVCGELCSATTDRFRSVVADLVDRGLRDGIDTVGLDLGRLEFVDSTGIIALSQAQANCQAAGVRLHLVAVSPYAMRAFRVLGVDTTTGLPE